MEWLGLEHLVESVGIAQFASIAAASATSALFVVAGRLDFDGRKLRHPS